MKDIDRVRTRTFSFFTFIYACIYRYICICVYILEGAPFPPPIYQRIPVQGFNYRANWKKCREMKKKGTRPQGFKEGR